MTISKEVSNRIPAGWYPDRDDRLRRRWWNGTDWTDYYSPVPESHLRLVETSDERSPKPQHDTATRAAIHTLTRAVTFRDRLPGFLLLGLLACDIVAVVILAFAA